MAELRQVPDGVAKIWPVSQFRFLPEEVENNFADNDNFLEVNVTEDIEKIYYIYELPEVNKEDIDISLHRGKFLTVLVEKKSKLRGGIRYAERRASLEFPCIVHAFEISAKYKDGVLTLSFPKRNRNPQDVVTIWIE